MGAVNLGARPRLVDASFENLMAVLRRENYRTAEIWSFVSMAARLPTIEAEPVKHGKWEHTDDDWFDVWRCTACGEEWVFGYDPTEVETKVNYCPNCGAKMAGEDDDV